MIRETSLAALPELPVARRRLIDGDHNYWTVLEELRAIGERAPGAELPLLLFHDVCWPHGRRDDYFDARRSRRSTGSRGRRRGGLAPGEPALRPAGCPTRARRSARAGPATACSPRSRSSWRAASACGWSWCPCSSASASSGTRTRRGPAQLARILGPWDGNPILERLEGNRVHHLARAQAHLVELWAERQRRAAQEAVLRRMLESSAFAVAEQLSLLRMRAGVATEHSVISKEEIRRVLEEG